MFKKITALLLILAAVLTLCSCRIVDEPDEPTEPDSTTEWIVWTTMTEPETEPVTEPYTEETQAAEPVMQGGSNNYYPTTRRSSTPKTTVATRVDRCDVHHAAQMQKVRHHRRQPQQAQLCARHLRKTADVPQLRRDAGQCARSQL